MSLVSIPLIGVGISLDDDDDDDDDDDVKSGSPLLDVTTWRLLTVYREHRLCISGELFTWRRRRDQPATKSVEDASDTLMVCGQAGVDTLTLAR
jgi:hypothetical protein